MYGGFLVEPDDAGAELGVLFWHKDGFSTACGHGTIALAAWAVESGRVDAPDDGEVELAIDVPSGRVGARVRMEGGDGRRGRLPQRAGLRARARRRGRHRTRAAGGRRLLRRRDLRVAARRRGRAGRRAGAARRADRARARDQVGARTTPRSRATRATSGSRASTGRSSTTTSGLVAPAQRRGVRRRRGRPLALRLGHLGPRRAARRRRPAARGRDAAARVDRRHGVPRARRRAGHRGGPRRGRHRGRGHGPPDRRAPLRARPARPARARGSCCDERARRSTTRRRSRALLPHAAAVDALEAALRGGLDPEADPPRTSAARGERRAAADALGRGRRPRGQARDDRRRAARSRASTCSSTARRSRRRRCSTGSG